MKRILACSIAAAFACAASAAQTPKTPKTPTFDPHYLSRQVKTLSSDAFEGRGPATEGEKRTVAYVIGQMKAAGLQPAGVMKDGKRTWTQPVPLGRFEITGTPQFDLTLDGKDLPLTQGDQIAVRAAQDGSTHVDIRNAPLVFVGYGVKAPERHWDDFKGADLHGKIAVALINDPDFETGQGDFGGKAMTYYGRWTYKYEEIARQGALGLLIIHETAPASYGWPTVKNSNTNAQFDIVREHPSEAHSKVEGWIQRDLAVTMFKDAGLDFDAMKKLAQTREFKPVTLDGVTLSAHY
ncbi:MAG TPA: peptidase M20, partial [Dyella sp.]|nr:peptidase M20 [Dyella sp.]